MTSIIPKWIQYIVGGTMVLIGGGAFGLCVLATAIVVVFMGCIPGIMGMLELVIFLAITLTIFSVGFKITPAGREWLENRKQ